jgi:Tfp pilus assembly protein PilN
MVKGNLKKVDLLRNRREAGYLAEPYFIDTKKYIKKGLIYGFSLIAISLILGLPFLFRIKYLENKKDKVREFSDQYDLLEKKLDKESRLMKEIAAFNNNLKNAIINISSSSALFQEIALIIPKDIQLMEFSSKGESLFMKAKLSGEEYLEILNSFLLNLENSDLVEFDDFDLKEIKISKKKSENKSYSVNIKTKVSTKYSEINAKYLTKLGSLGLFNRINILKNIENNSQ